MIAEGRGSLCLWSEIVFERSFLVFKYGVLIWFNVHWMGR